MKSDIARPYVLSLYVYLATFTAMAIWLRDPGKAHPTCLPRDRIWFIIQEHTSERSEGQRPARTDRPTGRPIGQPTSNDLYILGLRAAMRNTRIRY